MRTAFSNVKHRVKHIKYAVQSVCKQRLCLHFGIQNIEFYSTTIYIFMILEYNKLSRHNNQALQEHKILIARISKEQKRPAETTNKGKQR